MTLMMADCNPFTMVRKVLVVVATSLVVEDNTAEIDVVEITPLTLEISVDPDEVKMLVVALATN